MTSTGLPSDGGWVVSVHQGSAADFHDRSVDGVSVPTLWVFEVTEPALVLGSSQPIEHVDLAACARNGVEVVRRRSGGGAVLLEPGDATWIDVVLPAGDRRWVADVSRSAWWLGEAWREALALLGIDRDASSVHRGAMVHNEWSSRVCFAGLGSGEVTVGERKAVGISQRRTRAGTRFQCALYHHWRPDAHVRLLTAPLPDGAALSAAVHEVEVETLLVWPVLLAALDRT